jgi:glycerate 2-kinase
MDHVENAERIFLSGVRSVLPENLVVRQISLSGNLLTVGERKFRLDEVREIYVIGAGKASAAMAHYVESILGDRITGGLVVVKYGHACHLNRIDVIEAGHPVPDHNGFKATSEILRLAEKAVEGDLVFCLISGGGSALLADLPGDLIPEDLIVVNNLLIKCGASISEINCVRKHLSCVKGGQLSRVVWPASLITLILSDVTGNPLDVIASGPTVPDTTTFGDALKVIDDYHLEQDLTHGVLNYLRKGNEGIIPETPKPGDNIFSRTYNVLAGTNKMALDAAKRFSEDLGYMTYIINSEMKGDVGEVVKSVIDEAGKIKNDDSINKPVCLLYGGEPTVKVTGSGMGGRNQHMALNAAILLKDITGVTLLSCGTDGTDGPTDAAGAVVNSETVLNAIARGMDPESYLSGFDSYNFFKAYGGQIKTGPTFTNVMDIVVVLVE